MLPDIGCLSEQLRVCLQEGDENPRDFTSLFDRSLFNMSTDTLPQVVRWECQMNCREGRAFCVAALISWLKMKNECFASAYKQLNVKDKPLQLITPQFETPLPQLQPAVSFSPHSLQDFSKNAIVIRHSLRRRLEPFSPSESFFDQMKVAENYSYLSNFFTNFHL